MGLVTRGHCFPDPESFTVVSIMYCTSYTCICVVCFSDLGKYTKVITFRVYGGSTTETDGELTSIYTMICIRISIDATALVRITRLPNMMRFKYPTTKYIEMPLYIKV